MSTGGPLTSFVVTCHNPGTFLPETLASLEAQSDGRFEVIVVNDGSTDPATCRLLADLPGRGTQVLHIEQRGLPGARNAGARLAKGELLCMVDADDLLEPTYLARSKAALAAAPDAAFASHWLRAFGDEEWEWTPDDCTFPALLHANTVNGAALMRRQLFDELGGFDETMTEGCEDWEFWIRAVAAGHRGLIIPEFLFRYRRRADSMSRLMAGVPGAGALYRQLMHRHPGVFAEHAAELLRRRDEGIAFLSGSVWQLSAEWLTSLESEPRWQSDNRADMDERSRVAELEHVLEATRAEVRRWHAALSREEAVNSALTRSWSWRLTRPLRAAAAWWPR